MHTDRLSTGAQIRSPHIIFRDLPVPQLLSKRVLTEEPFSAGTRGSSRSRCLFFLGMRTFQRDSPRENLLNNFYERRTRSNFSLNFQKKAINTPGRYRACLDIKSVFDVKFWSFKLWWASQNWSTFYPKTSSVCYTARNSLCAQPTISPETARCQTLLLLFRLLLGL